MISDLFTSVLRMSLSASWMLAAVLLLRLLARPEPDPQAAGRGRDAFGKR